MIEKLGKSVIVLGLILQSSTVVKLKEFYQWRELFFKNLRRSCSV